MESMFQYNLKPASKGHHISLHNEEGVRSSGFSVSFGYYKKFCKTTYCRDVSCCLILKKEEWSYKEKGIVS